MLEKSCYTNPAASTIYNSLEKFVASPGLYHVLTKTQLIIYRKLGRGILSSTIGLKVSIRPGLFRPRKLTLAGVEGVAAEVSSRPN
jgi:hypothetical protein